MASGKTDIDASNKIAAEMYRNMGKKPPLILHFTSPLLCHLAFSFINNLLRSRFYSETNAQLRLRLHSQLDSQLYPQIKFQLASQLKYQLEPQAQSRINSQLSPQLRSQLYPQLYPQLTTVGRQLGSQLGSQLGLELYSEFDSQFGSSYTLCWWLAKAVYFDFSKYIGVNFNNTKLGLYTEFVSNIHFCLPYDKLFIYSDKPTKIHWNNRLLHNEKGKAVEYADGWGWCCLNGIPMESDYVTTPAYKITPEMVLKEANVDMRRELLRKIGAFRMKEYGKLIEKVGDYELRDMSPVFTGIPYAPHLLMLNPSVEDTWHLEGVHPDCHSVQQALNWRAGNIEVNWSPAQLN